MVTIEFSREALEILTPQQRDQILYRAGLNMERVKVYRDFSLPNGYVGISLFYSSGTVIYGGIDPEGKLST